MKLRLATFLLGATLALPTVAQTIIRVTAVPTASGSVSSKYRDGDDGGAAGPSTPELGNVTPLDDDRADFPLLTACTGGTAPLAYELSLSTTDAVSGFAVVNADTDFGQDSVYTHSGLTASTDYWARLACTDSASPNPRRSGSSEVRAFTTPADVGGDVTAPTVPGNLSCTSAVAGQVVCTWDASTDAVGVTKYIVNRGLGDGLGNAVDAGAIIAELTGTPPVTTYTDTAVVGGQEYFYRLRAADAAGNTSARTDFEFVTVTEVPNVGEILGGDDFENYAVGKTWTNTNEAMAFGQSAASSDTSGDKCQVVSTGALTGSRSLRCSIAANSSGGQGVEGRSELTFNHMGSLAGSTDPDDIEQCRGFRIKIDSGWTLDTVSTVIEQSHKIGGSSSGQPGTSPVNGLRIMGSGGSSAGQIRFTPESTDAVDQNIVDFTNDRGVTRRWVVHVKYSAAGNNGFVHYYRDGVLVVNQNNIDTVATGTTNYPYWKLGLYAGGCGNKNCNVRTALYDDLRFAEGAANCPESVDPANY